MVSEVPSDEAMRLCLFGITQFYHIYIYIYIYTLSVFLFRGEIGWMENSGEKIERKTFL